MGQPSTLQRAQTRPPTRPLPLFLGSHLSPRLHSSPRPPSLGRSPASWTFEGIPRSSPEGAAKPRLLAPSPPLSSIHLSSTRAQSHASSRTGLPSSFSSRSACTPSFTGHKEKGPDLLPGSFLSISREILSGHWHWGHPGRTKAGDASKQDPLPAPSGGLEGFYLLKLKRREAIVSVV